MFNGAAATCAGLWCAVQENVAVLVKAAGAAHVSINNVNKNLNSVSCSGPTWPPGATAPRGRNGTYLARCGYTGPQLQIPTCFLVWGTDLGPCQSSRPPHLRAPRSRPFHCCGVCVQAYYTNNDMSDFPLGLTPYAVQVG